MTIVSTGGAVVTTADTVPATGVVIQNGIAHRASDGAMYVTSGLSTAQAAALAARGPGKTTESLEFVHTIAAVSGLVTTTWQSVLASRGAAYAIQIVYENTTTTPYTIDKTAISGSTALAASGDPTGGTWQNVLFSGGASAVVPAAAGAGLSNFLASDWLAVSPLTWSAGKTLWYLRMYNALSGNPYMPMSIGAYAGNVDGGLVRQVSTMSGDKIATPTGYVGTNVGQVALPFSVNFRCVTRFVKVLGLGDSIMAGADGSVPGGQAASYGEQACNLANATSTTRLYSFANFGWGGQSLAAFYARLPLLLTTYAPDIVLLPIFSPNSGVTTQAQADACITAVLDGIDRVRSAGAIPILVTATPVDTSNLSDDNLRKYINMTIKTYASVSALPLMDADLVTSTQASPARWISGLSPDGLHPNTTATSLLASSLSTQLLQAV